jgi:hypothetical protein
VTSRRSQSGTRTIRALAIPGASTTSLSSSPAAPARICLRGKLLCSSGEESGAERDAASGLQCSPAGREHPLWCECMSTRIKRAR